MVSLKSLQLRIPDAALRSATVRPNGTLDRRTKCGTKLGRTTLVQCALFAQRYSPYLKDYYEKKKSRGTGKAIIVLARKFLGIVYRTLKNKSLFEDFPNFVLAEDATA